MTLSCPSPPLRAQSWRRVAAAVVKSAISRLCISGLLVSFPISIVPFLPRSNPIRYIILILLIPLLYLPMISSTKYKFIYKINPTMAPLLIKPPYSSAVKRDSYIPVMKFVSSIHRFCEKRCAPNDSFNRFCNIIPMSLSIYFNKHPWRRSCRPYHSPFHHRLRRQRLQLRLPTRPRIRRPTPVGLYQWRRHQCFLLPRPAANQR